MALYNKAYDFIMASDVSNLDLNKIIEILKILSKYQLLEFFSMLNKEECSNAGFRLLILNQLKCIGMNVSKL
jgi:hypothetical protein